MDIKTIAPGLSVSPQIMPEDVATLARDGFRTIICNRPDGEGDDQPSFAEISAAAKAAGMEARYIPVTPGQMQASDVAAFGNALASLGQPVLAYCRTGARSSMLWSAHSGQ